ncbi:hypothetical protein EMGBS4_11090 [Acidimicrobiaceae bacterium]|nr:hypothetical protein EMGBS4_11090 [Acidimicrobiaceae bacterium]
MSLQSVADVRSALDEHNYLASDGLATAVFLAMSLNRPLLLEGEAGVGKTELAKVLATIRNSELIRLQCYEGIDAAQAMYDWDYSRQLLHLRTVEATGEASSLGADKLEGQLYSEKFLIRRALLRAIDQHQGVSPVLLIDEIDRADDEFEAYLLEVLSDFQITIPELGTYKATTPPLVVLTSNRTRDVHDALKRRCLYHWVEHPDFEREVEIVRRRVPKVNETLARQVSAAVEALRKMQLYKPPGVAETIDWATAWADSACANLMNQSFKQHSAPFSNIAKTTSEFVTTVSPFSLNKPLSEGCTTTNDDCNSSIAGPQYGGGVRACFAWCRLGRSARFCDCFRQCNRATRSRKSRRRLLGRTFNFGSQARRHPDI